MNRSSIRHPLIVDWSFDSIENESNPIEIESDQSEMNRIKSEHIPSSLLIKLIQNWNMCISKIFKNM